VVTLKDFLKQPFVRHEGRGLAGPKSREIAKWCLDVLRNLLIVGVLFALAEKSGKWYMHALALFGMLALWTYVYSYWDEWRPSAVLARTVMSH
jgi:hypothetical protein